MPRHNLRLSVIAAALAAIFTPHAQAAGAGQVEFATAGVNAVGANGQSRPLAKGAEILPGETVDTGTGRAQLRFSDGGLVSLQPQTQFRLESYGYDRNDSQKNSIVMNLLKGGLRTITGLIGKTNRQGYKLQTPTATVGIRGTEFSITGFPDGSIVFNVADGAIDVSNGAGSTTVPGGTSATVTGANTSPTTTDQKPYLPPAGPAVFNLPPPVNPVQSSTSNTITTPTTPLLTGTFKGQWAAVSSMTSLQLPTSFSFSNGGIGTFTLDAAGKLFAYGDDASESGGRGVTTLGSALSQSYGNDGVMAWGRWNGGPTAGTFEGGVTYQGNDPLHYVVGLPVTNVPTSGIGTYSLYGGTAPSCTGSPCSGAITVSSSLSIDFANYTGLFNLAVKNSADGVGLSTPAGGLSMSVTQTSGVTFFANGSTGNGGLVQTAGGPTQLVNNASLVAAGFLAGPAASHAGSVYQVNYSTFEGSAATINGALVYQRGAIVPGTISKPQAF